MLVVISSLLISVSLSWSQPVGDINFIGQTYFDNQHAGNPGRFIVIDDLGNANFSWTGFLYPMKVLYNKYESGVGTVWPLGLQVSELEISMNSGITILSGTRLVHCYETQYLGNPITAVAVENTIGIGDFIEFLVVGGEPLYNPLVVTDARRWIHIIAYSGRTANMKYASYYNRSENNGLSWLPEWIPIDSSYVMSVAMASSTNGRVGISWSHPLNDEFISPMERLNNDLYFVESLDGQTWDFDNPQNITDFESGLHPHSDSLRLYDKISMVYGSTSNIHIAYTCAGYWQAGGHAQTTAGSKIYHYSNFNGYHYLTGELSAGIFPPEERRRYDRPSLGFNSDTDDLFCVWVQYSDSDASSNGFLNGEIYGAWSGNETGVWSDPVNMTNTPTPGAAPGFCQSENFPSIAAKINDTLHVAYFIDRDPGAFGNVATDLYYLRMPADDFKALTAVSEPDQNPLPSSPVLLSCYPNPFNANLNLAFDLTASADITLSVYDLTGRLVSVIEKSNFAPGNHLLNFDASGLASGIYFFRLQYDDYSTINKAVLIK